MTQIWLVEFLKGTGKLFLHPMFYYLIVLAGILGVTRVKRERRNFHIRVEDAFFELRQLLPLGILIGLGLSLVTLIAGLVLPFAAILMIAAATFLLSLTTKFRLLSPAYIIGVSFFGLIFISGQNWEVPIFTDAFSALTQNIYPSVALLLGLLIIAEGILIRINGKTGTSPKLVKSKRGLTVGVHESKRVWMLPVFLLIPGDVITLAFEWWPVFTVGEGSYSILLVPFAIGFHQQVRGSLPRQAIDLLGRRVLSLGIVTVLVAAASYWEPLAAVGAVVIAMIGREVLSVRQKIQEDNKPFYFSQKNHGVMILGIIPHSPASKMGLKVGELVKKVNGTLVNNETAFYEALQRNRAHCKLEVLDTNGEVRFVQRALYEGDHHELGILFVQDEKKKSSVAG